MSVMFGNDLKDRKVIALMMDGTALLDNGDDDPIKVDLYMSATGKLKGERHQKPDPEAVDQQGERQRISRARRLAMVDQGAVTS